MLTAGQSLAAPNAIPAPGANADVQCRVAATRAEREAAFRLVYDSYLNAGLGKKNQHKMRVTPQHLLPDCSEIFIATRGRQVIFTMTLILDNQELGLPMASVYGKELKRLRGRAKRLGEVSCLADCQRSASEFLPVYMHTCRLMVQYARHRGLGALVAAVHPKHARFYRRFLDFQIFGLEKTYPTVRNHPAVALWLEFARLDREIPQQYKFFFGEKIPSAALRPQPISQEDCEHFRPIVDPDFQCTPLGSSDGQDREREGDSLVFIG
jgi:hypothetical protein